MIGLVLVGVPKIALAQPHGSHPDPYWDSDGVRELRPVSLPELANVEKAGIPAYDETSRSWFASANGSLVRVVDEGGLEVVADDVQGIDVDVHFAAGVAVSREPGDKIVLHRFGRGTTSHVVLVAGPGFFHPRFSPGGDSVVVSESRAGGGHIWLLREGAAPKDLGQGYGPCWHPNGKHVMFSRIEHDGDRVLAADLWSVELKTGAVTQITDSAEVAETEPAFSPNGEELAFVDAMTGELRVVPASEVHAQEGR